MYYVTYSEYYPIYEPAEGGYYYSGKEIVHTEICQTFKKAKRKIRKWLKDNLDEISWISNDKLSFGYDGKYIGEGWICEMTTKPVVECGRVPYC